MAGYYELSSNRHSHEHGGNHSGHGPTGHTPRNQNGFPQLSRKFVARRISEGETGRLKEELKCQACGKGYKHVSSLAKHLWEHTPEWNVTSKLLISKHQQVQLLEAASILVSMNGENEDDNNEGDNDQALEDEKDDNDDNDNDNDNDDDFEISNGPKDDSAEAVDKADPVLTPAREIPILSAKPINKTPLSKRRLSHAAGSVGSLGSMSRLGSSLVQQASPLPESMLGKDHAHNPPHRSRRRSHGPFSLPRESSLTRDSSYGLDEDGLQDPHENDSADLRDSPPINEDKREENGSVFGDLEV